MWGRLYPQVILLIFANIFKASCEGTSGLTFVICNAPSMRNDIDQVKKNVDNITDIVFNEIAIENMVLVTFKNTDAQVMTVTRSRDVFKNALDAIQIDVITKKRHRFPVISMHGLLLALEYSQPGSYIYVFTDSCAKDYYKSKVVKEMCQRKQSQIVFVLTGICYRHEEQWSKVYYDIAAACSGFAYYINHEEINEVLQTIEETMKGKKTVLTTRTVPAKMLTDIPFTIDDQTEHAIVSASGWFVSLDIPITPMVDQKPLLWHENGKVIKLINPPAGQYKATVLGLTSTSVIIVGITDFLFNHGFSELEPKTKGDTTLQPFADAQVHLSISVIEPKHSVKIVSAQIMEMNEKVIKELPLTETSQDFYITRPFVAPSNMFIVALNGIEKSTCKPIIKISKIPVTPKIPPNKTKPTASIVEGKSIQIEYDSKVKLTCKVTAYPDPKIEWINSRGVTMNSSSLVVQYPYEFISYLEIPKATKGDEYMCYAYNNQGMDSKTIKISVKDAFVAQSVPTGTTKVFYGSEGTITCDIRSPLPMRIRWYYVDEITTANRQIVSSDKYSISADGTQLKIKKMDLDLVGNYTCQASLIRDKKVRKAYSTRVQADGLVTPKVSGPSVNKARKGKNAVLECIIDKGLPKPKITWQFMHASSSKFVDIGIDSSDNVLRIQSVGQKHAGRYKCVAENVAGSDEHVTTLVIQELPKITSNHSIVYQTVEGGALLKIPCDVASLPKPVITWKLNGRYIIPNAKYSTEEGALIIRDPKVNDTNSYMCEAKNEVGTVSATFKAQILQQPRVSGVALMKVPMGTPAIIECTVVKGEPKPIITWEFMDTSASRFISINGSDNVLRISSAENKHAGRYKCMAVNTAGSDEHVTTLIIQELPKITSNHSIVYQTIEGDALLKIPCVVASLPKPVITWKLNGRDIIPNAKYSTEDGALIIRDPKVNDTNSYMCEAKNEVGTVSATFKAQILQQPRVSGVALMKVPMGTPAIIECTVVKGEPKPIITWEFMDTSASRFISINGSDNVLRISSAENKHAGRYKCMAVNTAGSDEHVTTLIIQELPKITSNHSIVYQTIEGDALLKIPCVVASLPKPVITWKLNGRDIIPNAKYSTEDGALIIRDPKVNDTNSYMCEAKNEVGTVSATFKAQILQQPRVSGVALMKVPMGTPAIIECTVVKGEPKPIITWEFMDTSASRFISINGSDNVLRISSAENKHAGRYKCMAVNTAGSDEHVTTLIIQELPKITSNHSIVYQTIEGDALLKIPCVVASLPKPVITWKLNGRDIIPNAKYSTEDGALIIRDPKVNDTNSYMCEAKNEVGTVSATFKAQILQQPRVSGVALMKVPMGTPAIIECTVVKGEPKPIITWEFMDTSASRFISINGSDNVLRISSAENKHAGRYKCMAVNTAGSDEHVTTLIIQELPKITSNHSIVYQTVEGGALLKIPCVVASLPKPVITWKLNGRYIIPNAKYSTEDGALIIRDPKVNDTNSYMCEAKNEVGTVSATFKAQILQQPRVSGVALMKVPMGTPAIIECTVVKGEPKPIITWEFMDTSASRFISINGSDNVLRISSVENKHAGRYKCMAVNTAGSDEHVTTLIIQELPKITSNRSIVYHSVEGDALLIIPCNVAGRPKPVITWKLNDLAIIPNAKYSTEDGALIIKDPKLNDTNSYKCEAKNEVGTVSATFKAHILQEPIVSGVALMKVPMGTPAIIECTVVKGEPKPIITWEFMDTSASRFTPIAGSDNVLRISSAENKHAGRYKCVAKNVVGSDEYNTTLIIQELPKITSNHSIVYQSVEGDALLIIPCDVAGRPKPVITWKLNDLAIIPNAKYSTEDGALIIKDPKFNDTNSYKCEAKNEVGTVSATFKAHILQGPKISGAALMKVRMGTSANIECTVVKGEPKPIITWQFMDTSASGFTNIDGSDNVLRISSAENKHAGLYKCVAENSAGIDEHVTTFTVESPARIITKSSTVYEGFLGDLALRIPCEVVGVPKPVITWKLKDAVITPNDKYSIEDGALVIMNPSITDIGKSYTCEAENYIGTDNATFSAIVNEDFNGTEISHNVYIVLGKTVKLECGTYNSSKSQSIRWFIGEIEMYMGTPYITIENAMLNNDGNYTCRVSDKHGHTETHTYVVDVGYAPHLVEQTPLNDWRGEVDDILTNCRSDAKPEADVEWKFNGELITEENITEQRNSYKWGHYTCNVSNVHGSVQRSFDVKSSACLISRSLEEEPNMPLLLTDEKTWPKWAYTKNYLIVEQEEIITLSCPSSIGTPNAFHKFPKQSELKAYCDKQDAFLVDGKFYKLSDLHCSNGISPVIVRSKVKCLTETSELMRVGYNVSGFLETYAVCFDHAYNMPLYSRVLLTETASSPRIHHWYKYPGIGDSKGDRGLTCRDSSSSCCYGKSQLVDAGDFNYSPAKNSTFIDPLNAILYWHPCDTDNKDNTISEDVNAMVQSQLASYDQFVAWSGVHTLQEKDGAVIPRYLWKVLRFDEDESVAIVSVNDPSPTDKDVKCDTEACMASQGHWFTPIGHSTYCCKLPDFLEAFGMRGTDVGESLAAAYGKIKSRT